MYSVELHEWLRQQLSLSVGDRRSVTAQIVGLVRRGILDGALRPGLKVPSSRALAAELSLARNTIVSIYEQLQAEGFLSAGQGSGTYICRVAPESINTARWEPAPSPDAAEPSRSPQLSRRGGAYLAHPLHRYWRPQPFRGALLDPTLFPHALWNRMQHQHMRRLDPQDLGEGEPGGLMSLRRAVAEHIRVARGVKCQAHQVIITDSTTASLDLLMRLLSDPGDTIVLENPCYWACSQVANDHGLRPMPIDVDDAGIPVPALRVGEPVPKLAYLTPSNQFPLGNPMPIERRLAWLDYARRNGTLLIEDDYDSEYRSDDEPYPSLQGMDSTDHVIYLGTFSKTLYRGIRTAFVVVPQHLSTVFAEAAADFYRDSDLVQQQVLAQFIREGHFAAHIRRTRLEYVQRRQALVQALHQHLPDNLRRSELVISGASTGVHLTLRLPDAVDDMLIARQCQDAGVTTPPLSAYCVGRRFNGLVLSYAATPMEEIEPLVARIAPILKAALAARPTAP